MARNRKLTTKYAGFPMFKVGTSGDTFPMTSPFTTEFTGLDGLALDLQFATDKTLTARKGPTPVFTRGSGATFVDSDKLVKWANENLTVQSENFGATWLANNSTITPNTVVAPDGAITADRLNEDATSNNHQVIQGVGSLIGGQPHTFSVFAKAASHTSFQMTVSTTAFGPGIFANFLLTGSGSIGTSSNVTTSIESYPDGWYRCSITVSSVGGGAGGFVQIAANNNNSSSIRLPVYLGTNAQVVHLWGAQLERSSTARTYNSTTTAAFHGPRFDHDPVTGVCKGLLMEESRTNASLYSGVIVSNIGWVTSQVTSVVDGVGPDGNNAYTITEDTSTNVHALANTGGTGATGATSFVTGTIYTGSIFVKKVAGSIDWVQLSYPGVVGAARANFNLNTGTLGSYAGVPAGILPTIQAFGNGWYRCSLPITSGFTGASNNLILAFTNNSDTTTIRPNYAGNTANKVLATMCQFEIGLFPTSYIPTTTASVVRSADVCSITGSAFTQIWNGVDISVLFKGVRQAPIIGNYWALSSGTGATSIVADRGTTTERLAVNFVGILNFTAVGANQSIRLAYAIKQGDYAGSLNGSSAIASSSSHLPTLNRFDIGATYTGGIAGATWISEIKTFRKRLVNAKLQAITV